MVLAPKMNDFRASHYEVKMPMAHCLLMGSTLDTTSYRKRCTCFDWQEVCPLGNTVDNSHRKLPVTQKAAFLNSCYFAPAHSKATY